MVMGGEREEELSGDAVGRSQQRTDGGRSRRCVDARLLCSSVLMPRQDAAVWPSLGALTDVATLAASGPHFLRR